MVFDLFLESIQDNLDLFGHLSMEAEGEEQLKYSKHFEKYYGFLPKEAKKKYGRVYTRHCMLKETVDLTVGLLMMDPDEDKSVGEEFGVGPLSDWTRKDWKACKKSLTDLRQTIIENGAVVGINSENDESISEEREKSKKYNIEKVTRGLDVCALLAPLRTALKEQLSDKQTKGTPKISRNIINNFHKEIEKLEDPNLLNVLRALVTEDDATCDLKMKSIDEVRVILMENPQLSVERIATKTLEKLRLWNKLLFPTPRLYEFHFKEGDDLAEENVDEDEEEGEEGALEDQEEDANAAVEKLRGSRAKLLERVNDPLEEAVAAAENATKNFSPRDAPAQKMAVARAPQPDDEAEEEGEYEFSSDEKPDAVEPSPKVSSAKRKHPGSDLYNKKKSATQMRFDDDDDDEIPDPPEETLLSDLPNRAAAPTSPSPRKKVKKSQQKSYDGRRVWTDQEKQAVKQGIRDFGVGQWAEIKKRWKVVLKDRTSQQIKDCYRTMLKRGELKDVLNTS